MEHLTREQVIELLTVARAERERDWLLFLVTFWHGLRASEAVGLTAENFADGYLTIQRLKGSLRTVQPMVEHELEILNERPAVEKWLAERQGAQGGDKQAARLFPVSRVQFYRLMRRYGRLAGIPQHLCHPHVLKHSIAMQSIHQAGIENVRQYLGHKSIASTGAYLRVSDDAASRAVMAAVGRHENNP
ncbi:MAG: tyrosine-type recombinase/integrase [Candidatus Acidiferrales bacterium]